MVKKGTVKIKNADTLKTEIQIRHVNSQKKQPEIRSSSSLIFSYVVQSPKSYVNDHALKQKEEKKQQKKSSSNHASAPTQDF